MKKLNDLTKRQKILFIYLWFLGAIGVLFVLFLKTNFFMNTEARWTSVLLIIAYGLTRFLIKKELPYSVK